VKNIAAVVWRMGAKYSAKQSPPWPAPVSHNLTVSHQFFGITDKTRGLDKSLVTRVSLPNINAASSRALRRVEICSRARHLLHRRAAHLGLGPLV
jgi:hypothetical protein